MIIVKPIDVDTDNLTSNVLMDDETVWSAGTYNQGDKVMLGIEIYEALTTTTDKPDTGAGKDPATWLRLGFTNRWRMFRDGQDSKTMDIGGIAVSVQTDTLVNAVGVLGVQGNTITVKMIDGTKGEVYSRTDEVISFSVDNWYDYYFSPYDSKEDFVFSDLPPYINSEIQINIDGSNEYSTVAAGRVIIGRQRDIGATDHGTNVSSLDYSIRERDGFGNLRVVTRRSVKLIYYSVTIETMRVDFATRILSSISSIPVLYIGSPKYGSTLAFGIYRDFSVNISAPTLSDCTLTVEGF